MILACVLLAAEETPHTLDVLPATVDGVARGQMLHAHLIGLAREAFAARKARYESLESPDQIAQYQEELRRCFVDALDDFPPRSPLNARVAGKEQRDGYRIEKILFESQPKHFLTGILYLPEGKPPYPGVLVPCGHSATGKARDLYQRAPILLAKHGLAAFCYDPIDQGERHQLLDADGKPVVTQSTRGHNLTGVGATLLGRNTATYRIWDGMRAIDYLQSRADIDPKRIGCTGISGGGTLTSYLMALDERIVAAAPGCYLTTFERLLETIGPQDAEQNIFGQLAFGMDHPDYVILTAPRSALVMAATDDYFDIGGAWDNFRQAKRIYGRLEFPERVEMLEAPGKHGFPMLMRVGATRWMRRWLLGIDDAVTEPDFPIAEEEDLWCTPRGEVMLLPGARSVYDLNQEVEQTLAAGRAAFWRETPVGDALETVRRVAGIRHRADLPELQWEKTGTVQRESYRIDKLILRPEPGIWLPALAFVPNEEPLAACVYLHEDGKQAAAEPEGPIEKLVLEGHLVLAVDLRGIGETRPGGKHSYASYLPAEWRDATIAYLLGRSLLALRAEEVMQCARLAARYANEAAPRPVHLVSVGRVGPVALHAAALEPDLFATAAFHRCLVSWSNVVKTPLSRNQSANLIHGALKTYDLPDLLATLPAERVQFLDPLDAAEEPFTD
jgi:cephalosporin-C deacetylase-like acetyl esterase